MHIRVTYISKHMYVFIRSVYPYTNELCSTRVSYSLPRTSKLVDYVYQSTSMTSISNLALIPQRLKHYSCLNLPNNLHGFNMSNFRLTLAKFWKDDILYEVSVCAFGSIKICRHCSAYFIFCLQILGNY